MCRPSMFDCLPPFLLMPAVLLFRHGFRARSLRKCVGVLLACLASGLSAQTVSALTSVTRNSPATLTAGATVSYTLGITQGSERIRFATVSLADAAGTQLSLSTLTITAETIVSMPAAATWLNGSYTIRYVGLIDTSDRVWLYYPDGRLSLSTPLAGVPTRHSVNFSGLGFQLTGGSNTVAASGLTSLTRTSAAAIFSGETITYTLGVAHGANRVDYVSLVLVDPAGADRTLSTLSVTTEARLSVTTSASWLHGGYTIKYVGLIDVTNRVWLYYPDGRVFVSPSLPGTPATHGLDFSSQGFQLSAPVVRAPSISAQPISRRAAVGDSVLFSVSATGTAPMSYQWYKNGMAIPGAILSELSFPKVAAGDAASYHVTVGNSAGMVQSSTVTLSIVPPELARLVNLSLLTSLSEGESFTLGFVVGGDAARAAKPLLIRAGGPSLSQFGVATPHGDPAIELFAGQTKVDQNNDWGGGASLGTIFSAVGAYPYLSAGSKDAALYGASIPSGGNSVRVSGVGSSSGTVLAELYETTPAQELTASSPRLINVSVMKNVGAGMVVGFVVGGTGARTVLVRAVGPSLSAFGVTGVLADPAVTLFDASGAALRSNDNWETASSATMQAVGAFALSAGSKDAALGATLAPGSYTLQVAGVGGTAGVVLVEVYEVP